LKPTGQTAHEDDLKNDYQANGEPISLEHPEEALSVLEADQLVAAKQRTRFGRRKLSRSVRMLLWGLRIYVVIMLIIVLISVLRALRGNP
jgi:hypothetical protein